jgi:glycerol-3-phosphate dehydrogenase
LEQYEFSLVRKALKERDVLLNLAPHIIWPMRFILPHARGLRPFWMIRLGVWLYDVLASGTSLKKSCKTDIKNKFLNKNFKYGIEYSDCWVEDSRLVVLNAMDASVRGATVKTHSKCIDIRADDEAWIVDIEGQKSIHAQMVVNASGPWAERIMQATDGNINPRKLRLVKGSHIVIPKLYDEPESYILQNDDGRIVFTIPYEGDYTLVGTTDIDIGGDPDTPVKIEDTERQYLKNIINKYFQKSIKDVEIVHEYSGVRPLIDEGGNASEISRDYEFDIQKFGENNLPFMSVIGGKITTYRTLAQEAMDKIDRLFHKTPNHWTRHEKLPGGDIEGNDFERFVDEQAAAYPFLSRMLIRRYARAYGTCMNIILEDVANLDDMGHEIGGGVYGRELDYLIAYEFARSADDVLWRRSKLGLHLDEETQAAIHDYMEAHV